MGGLGYNITEIKNNAMLFRGQNLINYSDTWQYSIDNTLNKYYVIANKTPKVLKKIEVLKELKIFLQKRREVEKTLLNINK